jgi:nitroreductase
MIKKLIIKIFGRKLIELVRSKPFLINGRYREIISEVDSYSEIIKRNYGNDPELSTLLVRKFAHIIDKGLHRKDVEPGHSKSIVTELKRHLKLIDKIDRNFNNNDESILWAKEKLRIYNQLQQEGNIEKLEEITKIPVIDFNTFFQLIKSRRSNRQFLVKNVSEDKIKQLAETVNWASSSCNKQPIKLFATVNPTLAKKCLKQCKGGTGFSEFIPTFVAFCADMRGYYLPEEMYLPAIDVSLGSQNLFLAASGLGLSGSGLSWALKDKIEEKNIREFLNIPDYYQIIFNAVIGYAEKDYIQPTRKPLKNTLQLTS